MQFLRTKNHTSDIVVQLNGCDFLLEGGSHKAEMAQSKLKH